MGIISESLLRGKHGDYRSRVIQECAIRIL